ncbi:hypothetical protein LINPERPRIM_LOCUS26308 [Linum perenne]
MISKVNEIPLRKSLLITIVFLAIIITRGSDHQSLFVESKMMHIRNEVSMKIIVHCQSGDNDLGAHVVPFASDFSWSFTGFRYTLFWCNVAVQDKRVHFDAYDGGGYCPFHWVVNDTGVYANEPQCKPVFYPW